MVSARIYDSEGSLGPEYDHLAVIVELDDLHLVDVGFGDLFLSPLKLTNDIQKDRANSFRIREIKNKAYLLEMSDHKEQFQRKYLFTLQKQNIHNFKALNTHKQSNHDSFFVKNLICTKPLPDGRITIFNSDFKEVKNNIKDTLTITSETQLITILEGKFNIII